MTDENGNELNFTVDFDGLHISEEAREILEANDIYTKADLCSHSFKQVTLMLGDNKAGKNIHDQLLEQGLDFKNTRRVSLKTH